MMSVHPLLAAKGMFSALLGSIAARYRDCDTMPDTTQNSLTYTSFESIQDQPGLRLNSSGPSVQDSAFDYTDLGLWFLHWESCRGKKGIG
jgi:hypothetical protein